MSFRNGPAPAPPSSGVRKSHKDIPVKTRPTLHYQPGVVGRKTGLRAPANVDYTRHGTADPDQFFDAVDRQEEEDEQLKTTTTTVITTITRSGRKSNAAAPASRPRGRPPKSSLPRAPAAAVADDGPGASSLRRATSVYGRSHPRRLEDDPIQPKSDNLEVSLSPAPERGRPSFGGPSKPGSRSRASGLVRKDNVELAPRRSLAKSPATAPQEDVTVYEHEPEMDFGFGNNDDSEVDGDDRERSPSLAASPHRSVGKGKSRERAISIDSMESVQVIEEKPKPVAASKSRAGPSRAGPATPRGRAAASSQRTPVGADKTVMITTPGGTKRKAVTEADKLVVTWAAPADGKRARIAPLKYWAGEKIKFEKDNRERVLPIPEHKPSAEETVPKKYKPRGKRAAGAGVAKPRRKADVADQIEGEVLRNMRGVAEDRKEELFADVVKWPGNQEVEAKIFAPLPAVELKPVAHEAYFFAKTFNEGDFSAAGTMRIPPGGQKPSKNTKGNAMVFAVLTGRVEVLVNRTTFVAISGDSFMVPRGNQYRIRNVSDDDARLFFSHAAEGSKRAEQSQLNSEMPKSE